VEVGWALEPLLTFGRVEYLFQFMYILHNFIFMEMDMTIWTHNKSNCSRSASWGLTSLSFIQCVRYQGQQSISSLFYTLDMVFHSEFVFTKPRHSAESGVIAM